MSKDERKEYIDKKTNRQATLQFMERQYLSQAVLQNKLDLFEASEHEYQKFRKKI